MREFVKRHRWFSIAAAVVVIAAVAGGLAAGLGRGGVSVASANSDAAPKAKNKTDAAKTEEKPPLEFAQKDLTRVMPRVLANELALPGTVTAVSQATVRSKLSAEVRRVLVREGDRVVAGQLIAEFDTASLKAQWAERTATLESAKAQLVQNERTRQANAQLVQQNFISKNAFDTADSAYRAQAAMVEAAQAQLAQTQLSLGDAVVRAPISGQIAKRSVQPGEKVGFDAALMTIVDLTELEIQAQAPVSDVTQIARGAKAEVEIEGVTGRTFVATVDRINPSTEPGTRTINVYLSLKNENSLLKAGMFARARLRADTAGAVPTLPIAAVQTDLGQSFVWTVADGKLARRQITIGRRDERSQLVEVKDGLKGNESVLATRFDNLRDGMAAKVIDGTGASKLAREPQAAGGAGRAGT